MKQPEIHTSDVVYLSAIQDSFSSAYNTIRNLEGRLLSDAEVQLLPETEKRNPHRWEWQLRKLSALRFIAYLEDKKKALDVMDLGCGNGWFTMLIGSYEGTKVMGVDLNPDELEQASRLNTNNNVSFVYADIFTAAETFIGNFDIITLNACVQYFEDLAGLITLLKTFLKKNGEIHIMDSPFYKFNEVKAAKKRSTEYYTMTGVPEMAQWYYHHVLPTDEKIKWLYKPKQNKLLKLVHGKDSPFPWIMIPK